MKPPKGPVRQLMGGARNSYGIWKFAKNKDAAIEFLKYYADNWVDAFKASSGYNMPIFANIVPKPMPILSDDPTSTPHDKLAILQTSDEWSAVPGYPGPAWPATDEIYNNFVICDMMTKAATGAMTAEELVEVGRAAMRGHLRQVAAQGLMRACPDRAFASGPARSAELRRATRRAMGDVKRARDGGSRDGRSSNRPGGLQWLRY